MATKAENSPLDFVSAEARETAPARGAINHSQLLIQGIFHYAGQVATIISGVVLVPLMLNRLGTEAYGLWILALSVPGFVMGLDNILYLPIVREVAAHRLPLPEPTTRFLTACCCVYLSSGAICALVTLTFGWTVIHNLRLSTAAIASVPAVLLSVALSFIAGRLTAFANAVLSGHQMFQVMNSVSILVLIVRASVFVYLLLHGHSLPMIAISYAAFSTVEAAVGLSFAWRLGALRLNHALVEWGRLRRIGEFGVVSFLISLVQNAWWFSPPVLLGWLSGNPSANAALYAGQRPGFIISELNWRGADVIFAASASCDPKTDGKGISELLDFGAKNVLAIALPFAVGLFLFAPALVRVWLGITAPLTVNVMRLTTVGVVADALWVGPLHVLWALGRVQKVLLISLCMTSASLVSNVIAIHWLGPAGAALTFCLTAWLGAIMTAVIVARELEVSWQTSLIRPFANLITPTLLLTGYCLAVLLISSNPWVALMSACSGGVLYAILFLFKQNGASAILGGRSGNLYLMTKEDCDV